MTDSRAEPSTVPDRPLLVNGERLAVEVERVSGGGPNKFHPFTVDEARARLLPMASELAERAGGMPRELRANQVVFQATLLPNYLANSYFPQVLLEAVGLRALGSRSATGVLETEKRRRENVRTKSLLLAGTDDALERLVQVIAGRDTTRTATQAAETLRQFSDIRLATYEEVIRVPEAASHAPAVDDPHPEAELEVYEAVLHPDPDASGARLESLSAE
jgi:hypothetical protein